MPLHQCRSKFGLAAKFDTAEEVAACFKDISLSDFRGRSAAAAFYMVLTALPFSQPKTYYEDALSLLGALSTAKAKLDIELSHEIEVAKVTSSILLAAQAFVDETTIPCTEWASTEEIAEAVLQEALKHV